MGAASRFSRVFAQFTALEGPARVHEALIHGQLRGLDPWAYRPRFDRDRSMGEDRPQDARGRVLVTAILTSASMHDSQAAIPLMRMTGKRVTYLYDLADSAYCSGVIREVSRQEGHVPLIDRFRSCLTQGRLMGVPNNSAVQGAG
jgi:hypothetical protein